MLKFGFGIISLILAVSAIDGPTGYEGNSWGLAFMFGIIGIALLIKSIPDIAE